MYGPKGPGKDDCMKKLEKGNMRISPSGMHDQMMFFIISGVGVDVLYIDTFSWVIDPPIRIAIDTVTITAFFLIFTGVVFTMIIALSRVYIVSTKGITVILLGIFRHLYPWERFQMVGLYPISKVIEETPGEAFMMVVLYQRRKRNVYSTADGGIRLLRQHLLNHGIHEILGIVLRYSFMLLQICPALLGIALIEHIEYRVNLAPDHLKIVVLDVSCQIPIVGLVIAWVL